MEGNLTSGFLRNIYGSISDPTLILQSSILTAMNVTLVAYYGTKPSSLEAFLASTNNSLQSEFGSLYTQYSIGQVHTTIVGLENKTVNGKLLNNNYLTYRHCTKAMNPASLVRHLKTVLLFPIKIRICGYSLDINYGFTSQGQHPMKRSFSICSNKVVGMGWPVQNNEVVPQLASLRKSFEHFNILHKWHQHPKDRDNDLYFVLGLLNRSKLGDDTIEDVENKLRNRFETLPPLELELSISDLQFVAYNDPTLPPDGSHTLPLSDVNEDITNLAKLFEL